MGLRVVIMVVSLGLLGGAGYASWYGWGSVSADTGASSVRAGSVGTGGIRRLRVK